MKFSWSFEKYALSIIAVAAGTVTVLSLFLPKSFSSRSENFFEERSRLNQMVEKQILIERQLNLAIQARDSSLQILTRLADSIETPTGVETANKFSLINLKLSLLALRVDSIQVSLNSLESALMDNPSKALALPLLKNDLENSKIAMTKESVNLHDQIATIYDQNKWFIGLMITMAIGIISLAINNFLPKRRISVNPPASPH